MTEREPPEDDQDQAQAPASDNDTEPQPTSSVDTEAPSEPAEVVPDVVPVKPKGRGLAALALLLALTAGAGVGYLYYELVYLAPLAQVTARNIEIQTKYQELRKDVSAEIQAVEQAATSALAEAKEEQTQRLATNEEAVLKSLNEALNTAPPSQREWKLAEAEYLLRIANHRVLMEQDSVGALDLLQGADQILAELDDFALHQVRARLADEIIALRQVPRHDLQGIYLRLETLKSQIDNLPLPQPEFLKPAAQVQPDQSVWQNMLDELKKFIRIRSLTSSESIRPLLAPEEVRYLELNLRLALEQAQLATLKRQQDVFEQSLLNVRSWLVDHTEIEDARTKAILAQVDELALTELAQPLPEISGSLTELLTIRRSES